MLIEPYYLREQCRHLGLEASRDLGMGKHHLPVSPRSGFVFGALNRNKLVFTEDNPRDWNCITKRGPLF